MNAMDGSSSASWATKVPTAMRNRTMEYIIVHEMAHLLVRRHDDRFRRLMDGHLPNWEHLRETLNS
jgi:predicted metal-dependent hydrolase